jgi:UDP-N-acetylglucosamine diphosphorylase / glucose-1-phosphate thymidylyltransferase / UDP-N-acetylgalactosamine diphosphorylase / glucosamine-1-phosphate N-acetyltransferase / galactosamine-1-phosphate N-acetyltransferase
MKVLLLAAGSSSRVKPIEDKNFVKICGKTLLEWQFESLVSAGFDDFVLIGNASNMQQLEEFSREVDDEIAIALVEQVDMKSGMAGALLACKDVIENDFMVVSTNDVVEDELWDEVKRAIDLGGDTSFMVGYKVHRYFPGGYLKVGEDDLIKRLVEKPGEGNEPSDMVNLVVHVHRNGRLLLSELEKTTVDSDDRYEVAIDSLFSVGIPYRVIPYAGFWQAVKYPWHVLRLTDFFLDKLERKISDKAIISESAIINGDVVIGDGVKVFDNAIINGPAYIGEDGVVGSFGLVRASSLGERCVVGSYTEICRSNFGDDVWTHKNYVGDSVIGNNVSFGSGTVTGNLRLDEEEIAMEIKGEKISSRSDKLGLICGSDVRVGINVSFMPAVRVGSNSVIGAHTMIAEDIPEGSFVKQTADASFRGGVEVRENRKRVGRREIKKGLKV